MKVRILNQSIRFRISKDELDILFSGKPITSKIEFLSETLNFRIESQDSRSYIDLINNKCLLVINANQLLKLQESDSITIAFTQDSLNIILEKDFKCLTERDEDESNLFENPHSSH